jgi:hypothetical protein
MPHASLRFYISTYWRLALFFAGLIAVLAGYLIWQDRDARRQYTNVSATITGFGTSQNKWQPGKVWVAARTGDGIVGEAFVPMEMVAGCKIGDAILAERLGIVLKVKPAPCGTARH